MHRILAGSFVVPALLAGSLFAQSAAAPLVLTEPSVGLHRQGDEAWGFGPDYLVRFQEDGMLFALTQGSEAEPQRLRLRLASVHRDAHRPWPAARAELAVDGRVAEYRRPAFVERYELRATGVEQSFVFDELPPGDGDLVIGLDASTELAPAADRAGGMVLAAAGGGGIRIGGVTVLDAEGRTTRGDVRFAGGRLELVAPGAFVREAALPLVVDPLFGPVIRLHGAFQYIDVRVAYEPTNNMFLVVYAWTIPSSRGIMARLVRGDGSVSSGLLRIVDGPPHLALGGVATDNPSNAFIVVWAENDASGDSNVKARAVSASNGNLSNVLDVAATSAAELQPAITGEWGPFSSFFPVVYREISATGDALRARLINLNSSFQLRAGATAALTDGTHVDELPSISRNGGDAGRFLVTWTRSAQIFGAVIDRGLNIHAPAFQISPNDGRRRIHSVVDGDGSGWLVAYARREASGGQTDIACRRVAFDQPNFLAGPDGPEVVVAPTPGASETPTQITRLGESYLLAYSSSGPGGIEPSLVSIDPTGCVVCEGRFPLDPARPGNFGTVGVASPLSGGPGFGHSLVAWSSDLEVRAMLYDEVDGTATDAGGGCGNVGAAVVTCARVGNASFGVRLQDAPPSSPVLLAIGVTSINLPCGPCRFVANPIVTLGTTTTQLGTGRIDFGIPNRATLRGATFFCQWLSPRNGGGCLGVADFSDALRVVVE